MKHMLKITFSAGLSVALFISGCTKSEDSTPEIPSTTTSSTPSITINDGYGAMAAVKTVSYTTVAGYSVPVEVNTAVAAFPSSLSGSSLIDAGNVSLNNKMLTKTGTNAYVYQTYTDPLVFTEQFSWVVTGSGPVPAINYTDDRPMADFSGYSSLPSTVTRTSGLTISLGSAVSNADSVYVVVADYNNGYILKRVGGSAATCTFSASDLASLAAGQGMLQVCPWNYKSEDFSSKKFYFINEAAYTKMGITIN